MAASQIQCTCVCTCGVHYEREVAKRIKTISGLESDIRELKAEYFRLKKRSCELLKKGQRYELAFDEDQDQVDNLVAGRAFAQYLVLNRFQMGSRIAKVPARSHEAVLTHYEFDCLRRAKPGVVRSSLNNLPYRRKGQLLFAKDCVGLVKCIVYSPPISTDGVATSCFKPVLLCLLQRDHEEVLLSKLDESVQVLVRRSLESSYYQEDSVRGVEDALLTEFDQFEGQCLDNVKVGIKCIIRLWDRQKHPTTPLDWKLRIEYCPDVVNFTELPLYTQRIIYARHGTKFFSNWLHCSAFQTSKYDCSREDPVMFYRPLNLVDYLRQSYTYDDLTHVSADYIVGNDENIKPYFRELLEVQNKISRWLANNSLPAFAFRPVHNRAIVRLGKVYYGTAAFRYISAQKYKQRATPFEICDSRDILTTGHLCRAQSVILTFAFNSIPKSCPPIDVSRLYMSPDFSNSTIVSIASSSSCQVQPTLVSDSITTTCTSQPFAVTFGHNMKELGLQVSRQYKCRFCSDRCLPFPTERKLRRHTEQEHKRALFCKCPRCPESFWLGKNASWHQIKFHHKGLITQRYCVICNLVFSNLDRHVHDAHALKLLSGEVRWEAAST